MAIFGYDKRGSNMCGLPNSIWGSKFTAPEDGVAQSISVLLDVMAVQKAKCAIYDSAFNLLGVTEERTDMPAIEAWNTFNILEPKPNVVKGQEYYLVCWSDTDAVRMFYDIGTPIVNCRQRLIPYNSFPDPLSPDFIGDWRFSIYCTYTPTAPPPTHTLTVESIPISVPATLNEAPIGNTPVEVTVEEGEHSVKVPEVVEV